MVWLAHYQSFGSTPIKEPEELVYLFLAIAIGLGYGAGHIVITTLLVTLTLLVIYLWLSNRSEARINEYNLIVNWTDSSLALEKILSALNDYCDAVKLVRLEKSQDSSMAVLQVSPGAKFDCDQMSSDILDLDATSSTSFYEANINW